MIHNKSDTDFLISDALQTRIHVVSVHRCADLPDQLLFAGLQLHPQVAYFRDVMIVQRLFMFLCSTKINRQNSFVTQCSRVEL